MPLTDREASDRRAEAAAGKAAQVLSEAIHEAHGHVMGFRNGFIEATEQLTDSLVALYVPLCVIDESIRDDLIAAIKSRVLAFIQSSIATHATHAHGSLPARLGAQLAGSCSQRVVGKFDLGLHGLMKAEQRDNRFPPAVVHSTTNNTTNVTAHNSTGVQATAGGTNSQTNNVTYRQVLNQLLREIDDSDNISEEAKSGARGSIRQLLQDPHTDAALAAAVML